MNGPNCGAAASCMMLGNLAPDPGYRRHSGQAALGPRRYPTFWDRCRNRWLGPIFTQLLTPALAYHTLLPIPSEPLFTAPGRHSHKCFVKESYCPPRVLAKEQ
ncbi:TP53-target gene 1 protein [Rhinopithecus roxellana]|uniref:TP53-target gene 1 protein n=1 Tax=Rhinopithecus roxellana TaxID=61622 RepID=UPI00123793E1|nr:TP53-target gene 1 protein [Rhinopithecus roxellana]